MIDSETGLPMTFPGGSSQAAAPSQPYAAPPTPPGISYAPGATQLYQPMGTPTPPGQGTGQGGGMSPLLMQLLGGGVTPGSGMGAQFMPLLMQYLMGQQQQQQPQGPPPDPLTAQQRAFMGYGGAGQPPNWAAAMGMSDPTGGWSPSYQPQTPQQASTPQDFVSQWNQLYGRS